MTWDDLIAEHGRVFDAIVSSVNSPTPEIPVPTIMTIALQRSRHLVEAYRLLIDARNLTAASALIRMQLDSLMRVHACSLVVDPMALWTALETDARWSKVKSADGKDLTDAYLHEQLSLKYLWASELYRRMSGYVHLGRPHLDATIRGKPFLGMLLSFSGAAAQVTDEQVRENTEHMLTVTHALLDSCRPGGPLGSEAT